MLKLDERLASVCKKEREVKRQRKLLEEEMERVGAGQPSNVLVPWDGVLMQCDAMTLDWV